MTINNLPKAGDEATAMTRGFQWVQLMTECKWLQLEGQTRFNYLQLVLGFNTLYIGPIVICNVA
jgi:hypothetical protein